MKSSWFPVVAVAAIGVIAVAPIVEGSARPGSSSTEGDTRGSENRGSTNLSSSIDAEEPGRRAEVRSVSTQIAFQGFLTDDGGSPINATVSLDVALYDAVSAGKRVWPDNGPESHPAVTVTNGVFQIALGSSSPLPMLVFDGSPLYLGISVEGEAEMPRTQLLSTPYAIRAREADYAATAGMLVPSPGDAVNITEVSVAFGPPDIAVITGDSFDFGTSLEVTLGEFGSLFVVSASSSEIVVELPEGMTPGDYLLTVSTGTGQRHNDEYDLTVGEIADDGDWRVDGENVYRETGNVGIGTTNPEHALDVVGDVLVQGEVRVSRTIRHKTFVSDFTPKESSVIYGGWTGLGWEPNPSVFPHTMDADLDLPSGAEIKRITMWVLDDDSLYEIRCTVDSGSSSFYFQSEGTPGETAIIGVPPSPMVVDHHAGRPLITISWEFPGPLPEDRGFEIAVFEGIRIEYEVNSLSR